MAQGHRGYRRDGEAAYRWREWVRAQAELIREIGLPADLFTERREFLYFLMHGYNRAGWWNEAPWFTREHLDTRARGRFAELVASYDRAFP